MLSPNELPRVLAMMVGILGVVVCLYVASTLGTLDVATLGWPARILHLVTVLAALLGTAILFGLLLLLV